MKILLTAAECVPFAKVGGLADVVGTLAHEFVQDGHDARIIMPLHSKIKHKYRTQLKHICNFYVSIGWRSKYVGIESMEYGGVTYYFVDNEDYFGGPIYKGGNDEGEQYAFFCRAVLAAAEFMGTEFDIIHVNDWHTAMIPMLLKTQYADTKLAKCSTVLTIHNMMYQGKFSFDFVSDVLSIPIHYFTSEFLEAYGCANFLKAGLVFADAITTVSKTYAEELKYEFFAEGMAGMLSARANDLVGIINGIDENEFNPETDEKIAANYSTKDMVGKAACKTALIYETKLKIKQSTPLYAIVTRLFKQKGIDLIMAIAEEFVSNDIGFVILGNGEYGYEQFFFALAKKYPDKVFISNEYNEKLAHKIYAGADFFLMPSLFEPCGLTQMIAMRYGTLPIVRETGGLCDTVIPFNKFTGEGTGFSFKNFNALELLDAVNLSLATYKNKKAFNKLRQSAMNADFSFKKSAQEYLSLFKSLLKK